MSYIKAILHSATEGMMCTWGSHNPKTLESALFGLLSHVLGC
jgi:hypothetical protein